MDEQLKLLIAALASQMGGSFNPSLMASAEPENNVSPANIASAMNPNVLLSSGLVDPYTVQSGIDSVYQQMLAEWESRNQVNLPPEASDLWLSPVTSKYSSNDEVSVFMNEMFTAIKNGTTTAEKVKTAIAANDSVAPEAVKSSYADVSVDLDKYSKLAEAQAQAKLKFEITNAQNGVTTAPAPTLEQARFKFYKDLGAPEMALLPDAGFGYDFDPSMFGDKDRASRLDKLIGEQQGLVDEGAAGAAYTQKQADVYTAKGNAAAARAAGDKARQEYLDANAKPDQITQVLDWFSRNGQGILGKAFGKDKTSERKNLANKAGEEAMKRELARLNNIAPVSAETSKYGDAKRSLDIYRNIQLEDDAYNKRVADLVSQKLAAQGRTPNRDAINQLLGYAATVNKKN
jgi:hypothetical protein